MDVCKQLQAYEVEYHVLQDELLDTPPTLNQHQRAAQLERTNQSLRQQNLDLLEELQVSYILVRLHVKLSYTLIIVTFTHFLPLTHPPRCPMLVCAAWRVDWRLWSSQRVS